MAGRVSRFSYKRLKQEVVFEDDDHLHLQNQNKSKTERSYEIIRRSYSVNLRSSCNNISNWVGKLKLRRKFRVKFAGFRRFFRIRRIKKLKVRRLSWAHKVFKRLKESQSHFGELFAGNYLLMQVSPGTFKSNNTNKVSMIMPIHTWVPNGITDEHGKELKQLKITMAGVGCVLHTSQGAEKEGCRRVKASSPLHAELLAIWIALNEAKNHGNAWIVRTDSSQAVAAIRNPKSTSIELRKLANDIVHLAHSLSFFCCMKVARSLVIRAHKLAITARLCSSRCF